jgi:hypothetical protein
MADIRDGFIAALLLVFSHAAAFANSCSNVNVIGTHDQSGLQESTMEYMRLALFEFRGKATKANSLCSTLLRCGVRKSSMTQAKQRWNVG